MTPTLKLHGDTWGGELIEIIQLKGLIRRNTFTPSSFFSGFDIVCCVFVPSVEGGAAENYAMSTIVQSRMNVIRGNSRIRT